MCSSSFHPAPTILLYLELRARNSQQILGPIKKVCKGAGWRWGSPDSQFIWMTQGGERWVRWKSSHSSALKLRRQWTLFKVFLPTILIENCRECDGKGSANRFEPPAWYWRTISKGEGSFHRILLFHFWITFSFSYFLVNFVQAINISITIIPSSPPLISLPLSTWSKVARCQDDAEGRSFVLTGFKRFFLFCFLSFCLQIQIIVGPSMDLKTISLLKQMFTLLS